jgi:ubiquinone/menaquinone biosynthesis C-methylase UbiE
LSTTTIASTPLTFTGERFLPEVRGSIWYEHWHRYAAVASAAGGKRVLDAACGEGYGSFLLAHAAQSVVGIDISPEAIGHAQARYARPNLRFAAGSVTALPLATASFDLVVSFETIEHLAEQRAMLTEFRRVLTPAGALIVSSPNRPVYNEGGGIENHYHVCELDRGELKALLDETFPAQAWYGQRVLAQSALWAENDAAAAPSFVQLAHDEPAYAAAPAEPMYFVVACAGAGFSPPALPSLSLFDDGTLALWRDYARARTRERELAWDELDARNVAEDRLVELVAATNSLASAHEANAVRIERIAELERALAQAEAARATLHTTLEHEKSLHTQAAAALAHERAAHAETSARLSYRESARGWLRYPFAAARRRVVDNR